jgi:hypothetical protein
MLHVLLLLLLSISEAVCNWLPRQSWLGSVVYRSVDELEKLRSHNRNTIQLDQNIRPNIACLSNTTSITSVSSVLDTTRAASGCDIWSTSLSGVCISQHTNDAQEYNFQQLEISMIWFVVGNAAVTTAIECMGDYRTRRVAHWVFGFYWTIW